MNAKRVFIPIAFVTCASLGIVPAVYADVPSAQVTPLEEGVAVAGGVLGTDYMMDAATRGRCRCGCRPRFLRDSLQRALTRKASRQAGAPTGLSKGCFEARQGRTHPVIRPVGPRPCGAPPRPKARRTRPVIRLVGAPAVSKNSSSKYSSKTHPTRTARALLVHPADMCRQTRSVWIQ